MRQLITRTRAELDQPEPEGPTDEDLIEIFNENDWNYISPETFIYIARTVLEAWGRPAIEPVPVTERPIEPVPTPEPGTADHITDDEGTRWDRTMDASLWAKAFCLIFPEMASREDVMIGWFANAIMAGCDHQARKMDAERKPVREQRRRIAMRRALLIFVAGPTGSPTGPLPVPTSEAP